MRLGWNVVREREFVTVLRGIHLQDGALDLISKSEWLSCI